MILELRDITGEKSATAHASLPAGKTLADVFNHDAKIRAVKSRIVSVSINNRKVQAWEKLSPQKNDRVEIIYEPGVNFWFAAIMLVMSIISTVIQMLNQPEHPKLSKATPTYTFDGLRNNFTPGGPVPVVYGEHETGGQVLMYYVDVEDRRREKFYELIAVSEGEIESIEAIKINGIHTDALNVATDFRLGTGSQTIIPGFETIRNTFYDGRDFTPEDKVSKNKQPAELNPIIYPTVSNDVQAVDIDVIFPDGIGAMRTVGDNAGSIRKVSVEYRVRYSVQGQNGFILHGIRKNSGKSRRAQIDRYHIDFPYPGAWDIELTHWKQSRRLRPGTDFFRTILQNVTEIRGPAEAYTGTALVAVQGVANANLQGGQPQVTALVRGRKVKIYDSVDSFSIAWTQNPAWIIYDYMTNSRYGMGPYVTEADIHKQSFIDFATLANSQVEVCTGSLICSHSTLGRAFDGEPTPNTQFSDDGNFGAVDKSYNFETWRTISTENGVANAGLTLCLNCCPAGNMNPSVTGADTPRFPCITPAVLGEYLGSSGTPVSGLHIAASATCTWDNFTGYGFFVDKTNETLSIQRYVNQSLTNTGTILASVVASTIPGNTFLFFTNGLKLSVNCVHIVQSGHNLVLQSYGSWESEVFSEVFNFADAMPTSGGLPNVYWRQVGSVTRPVSSGVHNSAKWGSFWHDCGWCTENPVSMIDFDCREEKTLFENEVPEPAQFPHFPS